MTVDVDRDLGRPAIGRASAVGAAVRVAGDRAFVVLVEEPRVGRSRRWRGCAGLADRVRFQAHGTGADLDRSDAGADVLVLASRAETYGMAVTEALAARPAFRPAAVK